MPETAPGFAGGSGRINALHFIPCVAFQRSSDCRICADAAIALQHCVASVVCPREAEAFREAAVSNKNAEQAYQAMDAALDAWSAQNGSVLSERPD